MKEKENSGFQKFLNGVERVGNKLPHPFTMFMMLTVMIVVIAQLLNGFTVPIPGGERGCGCQRYFKQSRIPMVCQQHTG